MTPHNRYADPFARKIVYREDAKHGIKSKRSSDWSDVEVRGIPKVAVLPNENIIEIVNAAIILEDWDVPVGEDILVVGTQELDEYRDGLSGPSVHSFLAHPPYPASAAFIELLIECGDVVLDYRSDDFPFEFEPGEGRWDYHWEYDGLRPYKPHVMDIRDEFVSTISRYWTGSFINGYRSPRTSSGANLSLERAANLAVALSLGKLSFNTAAMKKVKAPAWHRDAIRRVRFSDTALPDSLADLDDNVVKAEALMEFWSEASDYDRFCMRIDREDLDDVEKLSDLCRRCGEMIGVNDYLDTFAAGVPAEDILA